MPSYKVIPFQLVAHVHGGTQCTATRHDVGCPKNTTFVLCKRLMPKAETFVCLHVKSQR